MTGRRPRTLRDDRVWQAGFIVGSALGAAATVLGRRAEKAARAGGLVDWAGVERTAIGRLRRAPGALPLEELRAAEPHYREAMERILPAPVAAASAARSCCTSKRSRWSIGSFSSEYALPISNPAMKNSNRSSV